jgi:hypothetical protein
MTEIGIDEMARALRRWQDFNAVNPTTLPPDIEIKRDPGRCSTPTSTNLSSKATSAQ